MQAAQLLHDFVRGAQMQMIGIGKLHLAADGLQILRTQSALDGTLRAHIHKNRGLDNAMSAGEFPTTGLAFGFFQFKHGSSPYASNHFS